MGWIAKPFAWLSGKLLGKRATGYLTNVGMEAAVVAENAAAKRTLPGLLKHPVTLGAGAAGLVVNASGDEEMGFMDKFGAAVVGLKDKAVEMVTGEKKEKKDGEPMEFNPEGALMFGGIAGVVGLAGALLTGAAPATIMLVAGGAALAGGLGGALFGKEVVADIKTADKTSLPATPPQPTAATPTPQPEIAPPLPTPVQPAPTPAAAAAPGR
jgi:hypothetical protein